MQCSVDHDSSSQATAGSRPVGSPWKATVRVPPYLGVVLAGVALTAGRRAAAAGGEHHESRRRQGEQWDGPSEVVPLTRDSHGDPLGRIPLVAGRIALAGALARAEVVPYGRNGVSPGAHRRRCCGSKASRRPSPTRLKASTVIMMHRPGKSVSQRALV